MRTLWMMIASLFVSGMDALAQEPVREPAEQRREAARQRELDAISTVVKGRCVDGTTGEPLAGCLVEVKAWGGRRDQAPKELLKPEPVTTGADGRFAIRVLANEAFQVGFNASIDGRWPRTGRWNHLVPGEVEDVGVVRLYPGVHAVGTIVDEAGQPVSDVRIGIDELRLYLGSEDDVDDERPIEQRLRELAKSGSRTFHVHANNLRWCRPGADGSFRSRDALPPGTWRLRASSNEFSVVGVQTITIPERGPMEPVTIVVREQPFIAGVVVDEQGQPVAGIGLQAELHRSGRIASARSRKDGAFKIHRVENCPEMVRIAVVDPGAYERPAPTKEVAWGAKDVRIQLQRALTLDVVVVEAATGEPVEDFAVRAYPIDRGLMTSLDRRLRMSGHHDAGCLTIDGVRRGAGRIEVIPADARLPCVTIDITGVEGMEPLRVELQRLVPMMVQVLDAEGMPVPKVAVLVIEPGNQAGAVAGRNVANNPRNDNVGAFSSDPDVVFDTEIYRATTDGGGQCIVYGIAGRDDLVIGVRRDKENMHRDEGVSFGAKGNGHTVRLEDD